METYKGNGNIKCKKRQTSKHADRKTYWRPDGRMDGWTDGYTDRWIYNEC